MQRIDMISVRSRSIDSILFNKKEREKKRGNVQTKKDALQKKTLDPKMVVIKRMSTTRFNAKICHCSEN